MNSRICYLLGLLLAGISSTVYAEAEAVFIFSGGQAEIQKDAFSGTDTALKIGNGFRVTENSGIEIYWATYGEPEDNVNISMLGNREVVVEMYSLAFQYVHFFPLSDSLALLGRIGPGFWKSEYAISGGNKIEDDGIGVVGGLGAEFGVFEDLWLRAEWEFSTLGNFEVGFLSAGIAYYFE